MGGQINTEMCQMVAIQPKTQNLQKYDFFLCHNAAYTQTECHTSTFLMVLNSAGMVLQEYTEQNQTYLERKCRLVRCGRSP